MKKTLSILTFVLLVAGMANAQFFNLGIKMSYGSEDINGVIDGVQSGVRPETNNSTIDFLSHCNAGVVLRMNIGKRLFVQPEVNFSINSVMDSSLTDSSNFLAIASNAFSNFKTVGLSVPVLVGWKVFEIENTLDIRVFAGPEFYTTVNDFKNTDFGTFSFLGGVGFDLLDFIYVDARVTKLVGMDDSKAGSLFYAASLGIIF